MGRYVSLRQQEGVSLRPAALDLLQLEHHQVLSGRAAQLDEGVDRRDEICSSIAVEQDVAVTKRRQCAMDEVWLPQPTSVAAAVGKNIPVSAAELSINIRPRVPDRFVEA